MQIYGLSKPFEEMGEKTEGKDQQTQALWTPNELERWPVDENGKLKKLRSEACQDLVIFAENGKHNAISRGLINNDPFNANEFI